MNISSRFVSALVLALAFLQMATATTQVPGANASTLNDCTKVGLSSSHTEDCCQCACGNQECSIFKELGEELTCDAGKIHCYSEDVNEDEETASEAQAVGIEGEWVKTSQLQKCSDIPIPSATETEDCCQCACGHSECAVFKTKGNDLTCDISAVHCYEPDEEDDDEAKCSHIPIPSTTETEDCCQCACGHSECAVFKTAGNELACDISAVHCYEPDEEDDDEAKCTHIPIPSATETEDCCQCACGHSECAVFKKEGNDLTCDISAVHCYEPDEEDDDEAKCTHIPIPSATETEDCCQCACGHSECAVFKKEGNDLTCDISAVHCYEPDEEDDDEAKCTHIPIPSATETEDCCQCACGHSECAVFKTEGNDLACDISAVHCYEPDEEDDDEAKCTHIPIPSATETEDCCQCACGHSECAVFKTEDNELTCDISAVHCYHDDDESSDAAKDDGFSKLDKGVIANVVEITSNLDGHVASNQNGSTVVIIVVCSLVAAALVALALVAVGKRRNSSVAGSTSSDNKESYETDLESEFEEDV